MIRAAIGLLEDKNTYAPLRMNAIEWGSSHTWDRAGEDLLRLLERRLETSPSR